MPNIHEQKFLNALRDIFVGAKIEGEGGFINLMRIKSRYYSDYVFPRLMDNGNVVHGGTGDIKSKYRLVQPWTVDNFSDVNGRLHFQEIDYSVIVQGYRSDFTNTICVGGTPTAEQQKLMDLSLGAIAAGAKEL